MISVEDGKYYVIHDDTGERLSDGFAKRRDAVLKEEEVKYFMRSGANRAEAGEEW